MPKYTSIIADGHEFFRRSLRKFLEEFLDIFVLADVEDGHKVLLLLQTISPDILIMDAQLPDVNVVQYVERFLHCQPSLRIILYSTYVQKERQLGHNVILLPKDNLFQILPCWLP